MNGTHFRSLLILCGLVMLTGLLVPAAYAVEPLWTVAGPESGDLSGVVISADGSTIVAGGDKLIAMSHDGKKLWTGWSADCLAISMDGNYILTSRDQTIRMISGTGTMLWDVSLGVPVKDVSMTPGAELIAAGGGSRIRLITGSGDGVRQNTSFPLTHLRLIPPGDKLVVTAKNGVQTANLTLFSDWADTNMTQDMVEVSADGSSFVTVTNNRVRQYTRDGSLQWDRSIPGGNALAFACSDDGSMIVVGRDDNTLQALDGNGTVLWTAQASYWITSVAVSGDGDTIAAGSMDKTIAVYDRAGTRLGTYTAKNPIKARSVAVSSDGSVIAAVDGSSMYGFSRSQFTQPVTVVPTTTAPLEAVKVIQPVTPAVAGTPMHPVPAITATQKAAIPVIVPLFVLALLVFLRVRRN